MAAMQVPGPSRTTKEIATMSVWNKEALKSMRQELGRVNMHVVMIKELEKSDIPRPGKKGFLSPERLQVVESLRTPAGQMNKVIDYLLEMEDKYFEDFCTVLEQSNFAGKAKMLREKAQECKAYLATMHPWNKDALRFMREELGGVNMVEVGMSKKLEKSYVPSRANLGFLSREQLLVVESKTTPAGQMNKVIDYLLEMEDEYFENFCTILEQSNFEGRAIRLRKKAEDLKRSVESQLASSLEDFSVSPLKNEVSNLQAEGGSDPSEREDTSNLLTDEAALKRLCWIPFDIKTVSIEAKGGILCLEPMSDDLQEMKEDTIFVEVPPDAVSTATNVKMRYAIIPSGSFTLPEGYQFGSPVVYINYDSRHVTKPLALHLPHCYGGKDHARDGLSFAVTPHSLKGRSVYHFELLPGGKFPDTSRYGVIEIRGHCSLFTTAFETGATVNCQAFSLIKRKDEETECMAECNIAVTTAAYCWRLILLENRPGWEVSSPNPFQFKSDRITATLKEKSHVHGDWRAYFTGTSELLSSHVRYDVFGIHSAHSLEDAVKHYAYPPAIKYIVQYKKELRSTGRSTEVTLQLHISDTDQPMNFPYTAYERIQAAPPPTGTILSPAQTETTSQPSSSSRETAPTVAQIIQDHADKFLQEMNSAVLAPQLKALGLIPETVESKVLQSKNKKDANAHLLNHLKADADEESVTEVFRIASKEEGYGRMKAFAASMLRKLQQGS